MRNDNAMRLLALLYSSASIYSMIIKSDCSMWDQRLLRQGWRAGHSQFTILRQLGVMAVICKHKGNVM